MGRNAIALAAALPDDTRVTCVELIQAATDLLGEYATQHHVSEKIIVVNEDFEKVSFRKTNSTLCLVLARWSIVPVRTVSSL